MPLNAPPQTVARFGAMRFGGARFGYSPAPPPIAGNTWTNVDPDTQTPDALWTIIFEHDP